MAFTDISGVSFSDDHKTLLKCPTEYSGAYAIPQGVTKVGAGAFRGCEKIASLTIPQSVEEIESGAFDKCNGLKDIYYQGNMSQWLMSIKVSALATVGYTLWLYEDFQYVKVEKVVIPEYITYIRNHAFYYCTSVKRLEFNNCIQKIGDSAFNKTNLRLILDIPNTVTSIGKYAFFCTSIMKVRIPESVSLIGAMSFANCNMLMTFDVSEDNDHFTTNEMGNMLYDKFKTKLHAIAYGGGNKVFSIDKSCKSIEDGVFLGAGELKVYLPKLSSKTGSVERNKCSFLIPYGQKESYINLGFPKEQLVEMFDPNLLLKNNGVYLSAVVENPFRVLGVPINATAREITASATKIKRFSMAGRSVDTPYDFNSCLPPVDRSADSVEKALSQLTLPNDKLKYALFWCACCSENDVEAFKCIDDQDYSSYLDHYDDLSNCVEVINFAFSGIARKDLDLAGYVSTIVELCDNFSDEFVSLVCGDTYTLDSDDLLHLALDTLMDECTDIHLYLMLKTEVSDMTATEYIRDAIVAKHTLAVNGDISSAKSVDRDDASANYIAAKNLIERSREPLRIVKELVGETDTQYIMFADSLAKQILQSGINYYNSSDDDDCDAPEKAMEIQSYAESIAMGKLVKERCAENTLILKRILGSVPPKKCKDIDADIDQFIESNFILDINDIIRVLEGLAIRLSRLKTLPETEDFTSTEIERFEGYFISVSTKIADAMLARTIDIVNAKLETKDRQTITTCITIAWKVMAYIDSMQLDPVFRTKRFEPNKNTLADLWKKVHSSWQTRPNFSLVILSESELYKKCQNSRFYCDKYIETYPNGNHLSQVKQYIEDIEWNSCKTVENYKKFIENYPTSTRCIEARRKIEEVSAECERLSRIGSIDEIASIYKSDKKYQNAPYKDVLDDRCYNLCGRKPHYKKYVEIFGYSGKHHSAAKTKIESTHGVLSFILGVLVIALIGGLIGAVQDDFLSGFLIGAFINVIIPIAYLPAILIEKILDEIL